ncbi:MAG: hypothetical protein H7210_07075, partial [Pyrinomonadaceae bacterium]|nr:hypothetical protein [Phycisphaerales bacterium]
IGGILVVLFAFVLLVLAKFSTSAKSEFRGPAKTLMWFCVILFMVWATLLTTVVFAQWPIAVKDLPALGAAPNHQTSEPPKVIPVQDNHKPVLSVDRDPVKILVTQGVARPVYIQQYVSDQDRDDSLLVDTVRLVRNTFPPLEGGEKDTNVAGVFGRLVRSADRKMIIYTTEQLAEHRSSGRDVFAIDIVDSRDGVPRGGRVTATFEFIVSGDENHPPEVPAPVQNDPDRIGLKWLYNPSLGVHTTIDLRGLVRDEDDDPLNLTAVQATSGTATSEDGSLKIVFTPGKDSPEFVDITYSVTDYRLAPSHGGDASGEAHQITNVPGKIRVRVMKSELKIKPNFKDFEMDAAVTIDDIMSDPNEQAKYIVSHDVTPKTGGNAQNTGPLYGKVNNVPERPWVLVYQPDPGSREDDSFQFSIFDKFSKQRIGGNRVTIRYKKLN